MRAQVRAARAEARPMATATGFLATGTMGSILTTPPGVTGPSNIYAAPPGQHANLDLMLMVPLSTGGRLSARIRSAQAGAAAAESDVAAAELEVALMVREAYRRSVFTRESVAVFDERAREAAERVRLAQSRFDVGSATRLELLRAEAERADAEQMRTNALRDAEAAQVDLRAAIGLPGNATLDLTDALAFAPETRPLEERLTRAYQGRPELQAARYRIEAEDAGVERAQAGYRPQVYGVAMADLGATRRMGTMGGTTLGITVGLPLLDPGMRRAEVEMARARRERARADEGAARIRVEREVRRASLEIAAAERNVSLSEAAVTAAQEQYRLARLRFEVGRSLLVEVLDALAALSRARVNRLQALYEHALARDRLDRAMGTPALPETPGAP